MTGRPQQQYTRYTSSNQPYTNIGGNNNLNIPFIQQNNISHYNQPIQHANSPSMASPYSASSSPGYHFSNVPKYNQLQPLKKYTLQPPPRQLPLSKAMPSLGYPDMFPQRPGQEEDNLTESNVRHGFIDKPVVSNEHTCAHDIVYGKLQDDQRLLNELGSFMVDVLQRQNSAGSITTPSSFKPPVRTTLIDSKREQWMQDLANGIVPLRKLARNVPHGFKGEKLLETLAAKQVPFLRATWFIKIVGLSEMSQRNASNATNSMGSQSIQWTFIVTSHLKKQLSELTPLSNNNNNNSVSSPHSTVGTQGRGYKGYNHDNTSKPWTTSENKARFEKRWSYSVKLARWQYFEGLLDQRTFLKWTLDTLAGSNSFEIMWIVLTGIIQDYIDEYKRNRTLTKLLIETLIKSYSALVQFISQNQSEMIRLETYYGLQKDMEHLLQILFLSTPDMFVIPKLYYQYHPLFDKIFGDEYRQKSSKTLPDVNCVLKEYWTMIKARNEVFCGTLESNETKTDHHALEFINTASSHTYDTDNSISPAAAFSMHETVYEEKIVRILDNIGKNVDTVTGLLFDNDTWEDIHGHSANSACKSIFSEAHLRPQVFTKLVHIMCHWATSESRYGDWKAYLVASILFTWREKDKSQDNQTLLQNALIQFLDNEAATKCNNNNNNVSYDEMADEIMEEEQLLKDGNTSVIYLFGVLIRLRLFSYQKYLLRLIARGDLELKRRYNPQTQQCLHYLASFPLLNPAPAYLINQRRVAIYGTQHADDNKIEIENFNKLKYLARLAVAGLDHNDSDSLFGADAKEMTQSAPTDSIKSYELAFNEGFKEEFLQTMNSTTRYSILNFTSDWLLNEVKQFVVKSIQIGEDNWRVMTSPGSCLLNIRQFITIIRIMEFAKDYLSIIEVTLWVLEKTNDSSLYPYIIDCFRKYSTYWKLTNNGKRIVDAIWAKHLSLSSRGCRERCIMMYMVQLVQEGYQINDIVRAQLQQDLQIKSKIRGRYNSHISIKDELLQLVRQPTLSNVQIISESLSIPSQNAIRWISTILKNVGEIIHEITKEKNIPEHAKAHHPQSPLSTVLYDFHRIVRYFATVIKNTADYTILTGQADEAVIYWLCNNEIVLQDMNQEYSWVPLFIAILVAYNVINLSTLMKEFALPWFEKVGREGQQHYGTEESKLIVFCRNLISVIRLLIIQTNNNTHTESGIASILWQLRIEEFFCLQVQQESQLASSLSHIEPMFGLMERLVMIATNLPLSSCLLQDLVMLRADLLQITWFRQACLRDLNGVYQRFAAREAEATIEKRLKKKMLNIVEELINGNDLVNERQGSIVHETTPDFVDKLHRIFLNVSQWNDAQCRVQINLLLDNISLSDGQSQNPNNPHILGDDMSLDMISNESTLSPNKDLQSFVYFFYDAILADDKESDPISAQRRFYFFRNLIHELREPVLLELLNHGSRLLEGEAMKSFPDNVLLTQSKKVESYFDSNKYTYRNQAFLNIMQHMLAENVWTNEKKIELVKTVFGQIARFKIGLLVYKVMESANVCYSDAANALQLVKNNTDMAVALLINEGLPDNLNTGFNNSKKIFLQDIRISLLIRLRLIVPFASLIWEHPKEDECDILEWIKVLVLLLGNPIIHGNGSQERFFEFTLDFVSLLIDEVPKELKKASLHLLGSMHSELTSVPSMFNSRVKRIMPFLTHNIYLSNTRLASSILGFSHANDSQQQQQHMETCLDQSKPWEWLEDYVGDPSHDNDAPISLTLFNARKRRRVDSTYVRWFKFGFDDPLLKRKQHNNPEFFNPVHIITVEKEKKNIAPVANNPTSVVDNDNNGQENASKERLKRKIDIEEGELP